MTMVKLMRRVGLSSEVAYAAGILSIVASIGAWATAKSAEDKASGERLGIFVGLWAPTFWEIGNALKVDEK
jgi:hypothetical protein